ncbi:uncharacterized protein BP01DRAFT_377243 [Aspergillus saccharolyticus JOP 1030-1]|uniref:SMODS and SLOG-associating 2TM effector domain-containing protein n=1 Tax=Aspergillus saccharolyticus JOP 1030-1 TaxID=1450539 RepID=A0A318Z2G2_9EURO|nr:hypothetical protein BP01DRAFT_377243 [Aspergillus saccharolyticus JOP 1030-1]PYH41246.1 hypothetical protein BP01DRAFT_377243 [Aspergillus saccharolyticus JOP 1030-1]
MSFLPRDQREQHEQHHFPPMTNPVAYPPAPAMMPGGDLEATGATAVPPPVHPAPLPQQQQQQQHPHPRHLTITTTDAGSLIPPQDKLLVFRALTGIDSIPVLRTLQHYDRTAPNIGIYTRVVKAEHSAYVRYRFFSILVNVCLGIQIVVAAALTALGAASGPHSAVTAFGAINTIMAGVLTYLKGSGLPDRLKHYQNEWRNIREYIEQRERELCLSGCELDIQEEIHIIEYMYEGVKREIDQTKSTENRVAPRDGGYNRRVFYPQHPQHRPQGPMLNPTAEPLQWHSQPKHQQQPNPPFPPRSTTESLPR